jgi:hypothetical protein
MDKLSSIISRVEKLLRVAERSDKVGEIEAAQSRAQELITKYQIQEAQLNKHDESTIVARKIETPSPYVVDKSILLNSIAKNNFCKVLRGNGYCMIYGQVSDIELCVALYQSLSTHMISEMLIKLEKVKKSKQEKVITKTWIKSFFGGYAVSISERIRMSKEKVIHDLENEDTSVALVVDNKQYAIEEYFQGLSYEPAHRKTIGSKSGYDEGVDSAKSANLNDKDIIEG